MRIKEGVGAVPFEVGICVRPAKQVAQIIGKAGSSHQIAL